MRRTYTDGTSCAIFGQEVMPVPAGTLGRNLARMRGTQGLTQRALAERAGVSLAFVRDLEQGRRQESAIGYVQAFARALGVTLDELLREPGQEPPDGTSRARETALSSGNAAARPAVPKARSPRAVTLRPRNLKDRALRWIASLLPGARVPLVPGAPRLTAVLPSDIHAVAITRQETDRTLFAEDGSVWTFEFQFAQGRADVARMAGYHLALAQLYPHRAVHTVVFWGRRQPSPRPPQVHQVTFAPHQVFLRTMDAEAEMARWRPFLDSGGVLPREEALVLAMLPLMRHAPPMRVLLQEALAVTAGLEEDLREPVRAAMLCLGYAELETEDDQAWARGVLLGMPVVGQELFQDLVQQGLREGELRQARQWLLKVLAIRLGSVPEAVRQAVTQQGDLERLTQWLEAVERTRDAAEVGRVILGGPPTQV